MERDLSRRFYFAHRTDYKAAAMKKHFSDRQLKVEIVKNGLVLPARRVKGVDTFEGGVCDNDFNFVAGYTRSDPYAGVRRGKAYDVGSSYIVDRKEITYLDEDVIFGGVLIGHFGHFILECLSRLWYVLLSPSNSKVLFVLGRWGYKAWFDDFFRLMGISKDRIIYVQKPVQCRSVIVPEQSMYVGTSFTKEYLIPYERIKANVTPGNVKKIYLSRKYIESTKWGGGRNHNEQYFEDFFVAHGFKSIAPEKLSLEEQISLILGADEIASSIGTLTHWALFCKPSTKFIMLSRWSVYKGWQILVNEATKIDAYVIGCKKFFARARCRFSDAF